MDLQKEREAFKKEFGIDDADTFPAFSCGIENSAALKCNWLGWKKRAEFEYRENPETIEIDGLKTIHKLCKFGADHNMEGCTFTEIVERMFDEIAKAQAVQEQDQQVWVTSNLTWKDIAFRALSCKVLKSTENWVHVKNIACVGSTTASLICKKLGVDPDGTKFELIEAEQEQAND